jgi:hypothetical protein
MADEMVVTDVTERYKSNHVEVTVKGSTKVYRLFKHNPNFSNFLEELKEAQTAGEPIEIHLSYKEDGVIDHVGEKYTW